LARQDGQGVEDRRGGEHAYRVAQSEPVDVVDELVHSGGAVPAHQHPGPGRLGQLGQRLSQHGDVVGGVVGPGPRAARRRPVRRCRQDRGQRRPAADGIRRCVSRSGLRLPSPNAPSPGWRPDRARSGPGPAPALAAPRPSRARLPGPCAARPTRLGRRRPAWRSTATPSGPRRPGRTGRAGPGPRPHRPSSHRPTRSRPPNRARPCPDRGPPRPGATATTPAIVPRPSHRPRPFAAVTPHRRKRSATRRRTRRGARTEPC
jgi:hypothetical protein